MQIGHIKAQSPPAYNGERRSLKIFGETTMFFRVMPALQRGLTSVVLLISVQPNHERNYYYFLTSSVGWEGNKGGGGGGGKKPPQTKRMEGKGKR